MLNKMNKMTTINVVNMRRRANASSQLARNCHPTMCRLQQGWLLPALSPTSHLPPRAPLQAVDGDAAGSVAVA
jgi:hypothetical protein